MPLAHPVGGVVLVRHVAEKDDGDLCEGQLDLEHTLRRRGDPGFLRRAPHQRRKFAADVLIGAGDVRVVDALGHLLRDRLVQGDVDPFPSTQAIIGTETGLSWPNNPGQPERTIK